jgi:hypothetical protein
MLMSDAESRINKGDEAYRQFARASDREMNFHLSVVAQDAIRCPQSLKLLIGPRRAPKNC